MMEIKLMSQTITAEQAQEQIKELRNNLSYARNIISEQNKALQQITYASRFWVKWCWCLGNRF